MDERLVDSQQEPRTEHTSLEMCSVNENEGGCDSRLLERRVDRTGDSVPTGRPPGPAPGQQLRKKPDPYKGYMKLCLSGLALMGIAYVTHFIDPVQIARDLTMTMKDGSYLYKMWKSPPIKLYIKIFMFNITNSERFVKGQDKKLKVTEVGPYTYSETVTNEDIVWNPNNTISFTPSRSVQFEPDMSIGDPEKDVIIVPNIPLLGIASMLHNSSTTINLAISTLVSYLDSQPILKMPINDFLWGYEDPLVRLAQKMLPSWINFVQFGLLDRMMDEGKNRITMSLSKNNDTSEFSIQRFNGLPGLKAWGYVPGDQQTNSIDHCNLVEGAYEGYLFPRNIEKGQSFTVYRKAFCRPLPLRYSGEGVNPVGYPEVYFRFPDDILDPTNPDNACYCKSKTEQCLPNGLSDLSPCYYNIPVAISLPHFLNGNKSLHEAVEGMSPDPEKHDTIFAVQPEVGVPTMVKTRLQTNLVVKKTRFIPRVKPFNNLVMPIFWMQVELLGLPFSVNFLIVLLLQVGPVAQRVGIILSFGLGLLLVFIANLRYAWYSGLFNSRRTATLISYKQKQRQQEKIIWRNSRYSQLLASPQVSPSNERTR